MYSISIHRQSKWPKTIMYHHTEGASQQDTKQTRQIVGMVPKAWLRMGDSVGHSHPFATYTYKTGVVTRPSETQKPFRRLLLPRMQARSQDSIGKASPYCTLLQKTVPFSNQTMYRGTCPLGFSALCPFLLWELHILTRYNTDTCRVFFG